MWVYPRPFFSISSVSLSPLSKEYVRGVCRPAVSSVSVGADAVLDAVDLRVSDSMVDAEGISASKPHAVFLANATFDRCFAHDYAAVLYSSGGAVSLVDVLSLIHI